MPKLKRTETDDAFVGRLRLAVNKSPSVSALARDIERSEGAIRGWLEGRSQPNATDLILLCRATGVRSEWLLDGAGEMSAAEQRVAEERSRYCTDENHFAKELIVAVITTLEEELSRAKLNPPPAKRADLVAALCMLFRHDGEVQREAVQMMVRVAR